MGATETSDQCLDTLVVGAGPAGLAAAAACTDTGRTVVIAEAGRGLESRRRDDPSALTHGVGGAGLYSDGKFSYYPSATALWQLAYEDSLKRAYLWFQRNMLTYGHVAPGFPATRAQTEIGRPRGGLYRKQYDSVYLPLEKRLALIRDLVVHARGSVATDHFVTDLEHSGQFWSCNLRTMGHERRLRTRTVIFAGVRFGPMLFEASSSVPITFRHIEVGIRIEQPADGFFLDGETQLDPKLKFDHIGDDASVRTFCCCRGGEVIKTSTLGIWSVSGRADGPKTSRSNVGFNVRLTNEIHATQIWSGLRKRMSALTLLPTPEELDKFIAAAEGSSGTSPIVELLGSDISRLLASGLRQAQHSHPLLRSGNAVVWAPTVEGIGFYPRVDSGLRVLPGLWVAGDATGVFRGLTASMVSGYYCGLQAQNLGG